MHRGSRGFTLVELMIVVSIIGMLAIFAAPALLKATQRARCARTANDLKVFGAAFVTYAVENMVYPPDSHTTLPAGAGMEAYLDADKWYAESAIGGNYNWEGPDSYPYAGISLYNCKAPQHMMVQLDKFCDDGNLGSGAFRHTANGRLTYIVDE